MGGGKKFLLHFKVNLFMSSNPFSHAYFKTLLLHLILTSITGVLNLAPCCRVIVQTFARLQHKSHFFLCSLYAFFSCVDFGLSIIPAGNRAINTSSSSLSSSSHPSGYLHSHTSMVKSQLMNCHPKEQIDWDMEM